VGDNGLRDNLTGNATDSAPGQPHRASLRLCRRNRGAAFNILACRDRLRLTCGADSSCCKRCEGVGASRK
jgi:hypothetical protein